MADFVRLLNETVVHVFQLLAIAVLAIGAGKALIIYVRGSLGPARFRGQQNRYRAIQYSRLELGHAFSLGLGFLIGASILKTTLAPSWNDIGQLAAIIAIRTVLNYFMLRDIQLQEKQQAGGETGKGHG
jgi:uncharacterized membrane protein